MSKLKPCPFCGGEAAIYNYEKMLTGQYKMVECKKCHCTSEKFKKVEDAIAAWNTRKPIQTIVEQLEDATFPHNFGGEVQMMILKKKAIEIIKEEGDRYD